MNRVSLRIAMLVMVLLAALPFGAADAKPSSGPKDELVVGVSQFPAILHPSIESMIVKAYALGFVHRPITVYDARWALNCVLCVMLPTIENGQAKLVGKGMAVTFTLRPEAKWGDGTPLTTDDVLFSWNVGRHPQSGVANASIYRNIEKIEAKDKKTFTIHLARATFDYNVMTDFRLLPAHIEKANFAEPQDYRKRSAYMANPTNPGLYSGPYRVAAVIQGSHLVLERNIHWWGAAPNFKRIVIRAIEDTAALEAALLAGEIDMIAGESGLPLDQAVSLDNRKPEGIGILFKPGLVYEHIDINPDNAALRDVRVRQAILLGFDRKAVSREIFGNRLPVAHSSVSPLDSMFAANVARYEYDPRKANSLLDEAGWTRAGSGTRRNAQGEPLVLELSTTAGNHSRELIQQVMQMSLRKVGIDVLLKSEVPRAFFGNTVTKRKFPGMAMYSWFGTPGQVPRSTLHSSAIPTAENSFSGQNFTGFAHPEMDALIDAIEIELNQDKRTALWGKLQALYARELPALPLYFNTSTTLVPSWLKGVEPTGHDAPTSLWVETWAACAPGTGC
jgi:peptide/nickel transport system substrate-binding protein